MQSLEKVERGKEGPRICILNQEDIYGYGMHVFKPSCINKIKRKNYKTVIINAHNFLM